MPWPSSYVSDGLTVDITLMSNGTGNGTVSEWPGGPGVMSVDAAFGGGSVKLQMLGPAGVYVDVANASLSAAGTVNFDLPPGTKIRAVATTATAVFARAQRAHLYGV